MVHIQINETKIKNIHDCMILDSHGRSDEVVKHSKDTNYKRVKFLKKFRKRIWNRKEDGTFEEGEKIFFAVVGYAGVQDLLTKIEKINPYQFGVWLKKNGRSKK